MIEKPDTHRSALQRARDQRRQPRVKVPFSAAEIAQLDSLAERSETTRTAVIQSAVRRMLTGKGAR